MAAVAGVVALWLVQALTLAAAQSVGDGVRGWETARLAALAANDVAAVEPLHADGAWFVGPRGVALSRADLFAALASGVVGPSGAPLRVADYVEAISPGATSSLVWEPSEMEVMQEGSLAVARYRSHLSLVLDGAAYPLFEYWHVSVLQDAGDGWRVVWSQVTEVEP